MGTTFFESMSGELFDAAGEAHHLAFDVRATSRRSLLRLAVGEHALSGTVRARPWATGAPCQGSLRVSPLAERGMRYRLEFTGDDGARYQLEGRKDLAKAGLFQAMSTLATTLSREGAPLAAGTLRFDFNDLPAFLRSFSPITALHSVDLIESSANGPAAPVISPAEERCLRALAPALIAPGQRTPPADAVTHAALLRLLPHLPPALLAGWRAALAGLDLAARARHGRAFADLSPEAAARLLDALESLGGGAALQALSMPIKTAHWSRPDYLAAIGYPTDPAPPPEPPPPWMQRHVPPEALEDEAVEADVVILGTGAGGGPVAATLAEAGLAVVVLEEGRYYRREDFGGPADARLVKFWRDTGMQLGLGNSPIAVPTARLVGGATAINSGTCFRTPDEVLLEWRLEGLGEDFRPDRFGAWLDRVEAELQVKPADPRYLGQIAAVVARGADALGAAHGPLRRNAPDCDGQGVCPYGCPTDAKRSSNVSWIPRAMKAGATLFTGLKAQQVLISGGRAVGVAASGQDAAGVTRRLTVRARAVVVACGTLESPLLLARSGVALPWLGRNLTVHPAMGVFARFDQDLGEPWRAIPQSYGVHGLVDPRVRFEGFFAPPGLAQSGLPLRGAALTAWMDDWAKVGQFGFMVRDRGAGRVRPGPGGRPLITWTMQPDVLDLLRRGYAALAEILLRGGAVEVLADVGRIGPIRSVEAAQAVARTPLAPGDLRLMGFHPLGTARVATGLDRGVVDEDHQVFGLRDLYVIDGASVPSSLGVNPQLTIMAMALRAADRLAGRLG